MSENRIYSGDSSALIDGLERYYPEKQFPALWGSLGIDVGEVRR